MMSGESENDKCFLTGRWEFPISLILFSENWGARKKLCIVLRKSRKNVPFDIWLWPQKLFFFMAFSLFCRKLHRFLNHDQKMIFFYSPSESFCGCDVDVCEAEAQRGRRCLSQGNVVTSCRHFEKQEENLRAALKNLYSSSKNRQKSAFFSSLTLFSCRRLDQWGLTGLAWGCWGKRNRFEPTTCWSWASFCWQHCDTRSGKSTKSTRACWTHNSR